MNTSRPAHTAIEAMTCLVVAFFFSGIAIASIQKQREAAFQAQCRNNLRKIGQGWATYATANGHFPRGANFGPWYDGPNRPMAPGDTLTTACGGWMWQILPHNGHTAIYKQERAESGFDAMKTLYATVVPEYLCPSRMRPHHYTVKHDNPPFTGKDAMVVKATFDYAASTGKGNDGVFDRVAGDIRPPNIRKAFRTMKESDIKDGLSSTVFFAESWVGIDEYTKARKLPERKGGRPWPDQFIVDMRPGWPDGETLFQTTRGVGKNREDYSPKPDGFVEPDFFKMPSVGSAHPLVTMACAGDGSVRHIAYTIDPSVWASLCSRNDGAKVEWPAE